MDVDDKVLRGAGGTGGKLRLACDGFSSVFGLSSEFGADELLTPRFLDGGGAGF